MVCNGPNGCLADCMLRNCYHTLSKTALKKSVFKYFLTDRRFCSTDRHLINLFKWPIFPLSQVEHTLCSAISVFFLCTILAIWSEKSHDMYFAVILICMLPSDHAVDKMSVSHTNKNEIYMLYFVWFKNY